MSDVEDGGDLGDLGDLGDRADRGDRGDPGDLGDVRDIWEEVWDAVNAAFQTLAAAVEAAGRPGLSWSAGHSDNKAFPFRAYASFRPEAGADPDADPDADADRTAESVDIVASVDFHRTPEGTLSYSADIARDDGPILADGPSGSIAAAAATVGDGGGEDAMRAEIRAAVAEIVRFLVSGEEVLDAALERRMK